MAKILQFSLQSVLDVRSSQRKQQRAELAALVHQEAYLLASEQSTAAELGTCEQQIRELSRQATILLVPLSELEQRRERLVRQHKEILLARESVAEQIERQRLVLVEADRQVRSLEKLRQRRQEEADRELRRQEARNF
jgi:flagellar protein FliJ